MDVKSEQRFIGRVALVVNDLEKVLNFYQEHIGLRLLSRDESFAHLGSDNQILLSLESDPSATHLSDGVGLYHLALLLPSRTALALQIQHFIRSRTRLSGMSDHLVSEALYLADPEGNGIEIYADRPRQQWQWINGEVDMQTIPLNMEELAALLPEAVEEWQGIPSGTTMGHVHLRVSDLKTSGEFYTGIVGLDVTTRSYPGALFLSKNGYHHHIGLNTWRSSGAPPKKPGSAGMRYFEFVPESMAEWRAIRDRAIAAGYSAEEESANGFYLADPSGNRILFRQAT